jgi:hypothetical protein
MRRISTAVTRLALAAVLLVGAVAAVGAVVPSSDEPLGRVQPSFRVRGHITGLVPGVPDRMRVEVVNRYGFPIRVTRVGAQVTSPTSACAASNLAVRTWHGSRRIPADAKRRVTLKVTLRGRAPVGCAGVRFRLHYTGRATRAVAR